MEADLETRIRTAFSQELVQLSPEARQRILSRLASGERRRPVRRHGPTEG